MRKKNKNKREDKGVLSHGGESGDSHADPFRRYFLIQKDCQSQLVGEVSGIVARFRFYPQIPTLAFFECLFMDLFALCQLNP